VKRETKAFSEAVLKKSKPVRVECQLQKELTSCSVLLLKISHSEPQRRGQLTAWWPLNINNVCDCSQPKSHSWSSKIKMYRT